MQEIFNSIYKGKRVLMTGHSGFKGSWLTAWLTYLGAEVIGYALEPPSDPNMFQTIGLDKEVLHIRGDVRDQEHLLTVFKKYKPEFVFHLAAQPLVRFSYTEPKLTYETNVLGTVNVLEAVRTAECVRVCVIVTSDKCYENKEWVFGYRETDNLGGYDPYSSSKGCTELVANAYRNSFFNPESYGKKHQVALSSVRAGNVIGGGDWGEDRLIPDCVKALSQNQKILIRNPLAIRPWQFVLEPLSGYLWLGVLMYENGMEYSDVWNFGPYAREKYSVEEVVRKILRLWGKGEFIVRNDAEYHEGSLLKLDISKAQHYLKWDPAYNTDEAIEKTINWYKAFYEGGLDMHEYVGGQIKDYIEKARKLGIEWSREQ